MHDWLGNSFKAQEIDKSRCSTGRSTVRDGRASLGEKFMNCFWDEYRSATVERGAKIDNYEDAEMSFYFDWTYARDGCNEDGARRG